MEVKIVNFLNFVENQETGERYYKNDDIDSSVNQDGQETEESIGHITVYQVKEIYVIEDFYIDFSEIDYELNIKFFKTRKEVNNYIQEVKDSLL